MKETGFVAYQHEVKAILEGRQTMFRRVIKNQRSWWLEVAPCPTGGWWAADAPLSRVKVVEGVPGFACPYGQVGDRLWLRETFALMIPAGASIHAQRIPHYRADADTAPRWTPSIHMPRSASRITLEITGVKAERIQDISEKDCYAEGIEQPHKRYDGVSEATRLLFQYLWDSSNGGLRYGWHMNPWDWAVTFRRLNR